MLHYLGIADLPGKMAHSIQEMNMCEAFSEAGEEVIYIHGHVLGENGKTTWDDIAAHYGLETRFEIKTFRNLMGKTGPITEFGTMSMAGPISASVFLDVLTGRLGNGDIIYGRNYYPIYFLTELLKLVPKDSRPVVAYEYHDPTNAKFTDRFFNQVDAVVCITEKLRDYTVNNYGVDQSRILVAPDGVDLSPYKDLSKEEAREELNLPSDGNIVMYTGHCYEGKGVRTLVNAADGLDASVYIVGGYQKDIDRVKQEVGHPENIRFTGFVSPSKIPVYQLASDILVAPYSEDARNYLSPLKLFEYMAAGRPIVASNLDVLKEVLHQGDNALLVSPNNPQDLKTEISLLLTDGELYEDIAYQARTEVEKYTWIQRAKKIIHACNYW